MQTYPALLIGRLGVSAEYAGQGVGSQLMAYIKFKPIPLSQFMYIGFY